MEAQLLRQLQQVPAVFRLSAAPPSFLLLPPSEGFPCGLYKAICHSDLYSEDRWRSVLHYGITRQEYSLFSSQSVFRLQLCPARWLPHSVLKRVSNLKSEASQPQYPHFLSHCYNSPNFVLCSIHSLNVSQLFYRSHKGSDFTG